jgi:FXSXX-COOH protein
MAAVQMGAVVSGVSDMHDLPLDIEVNIDDSEYARIIKRLTTEGGGTDTQVSAFNSSI